MRAIKIRAWNISGEQWEYFTLEELACMGIYTHVKGTSVSICHWDNYRWWCQFTGLKDKNGKDAYDGHICQVQNQDGKYDIGVIRYYEEMGQWFIEFLDGETEPLWEFVFEIIGDVHTTPELLEEKP